MIKSKYVMYSAYVILIVFISMFDFENVQAKEVESPKHDMRAVFISTNSNIDLPVRMDKKEYTEWAHKTVKTLHQKNFNTIIFQVKPTSDALYPSKFAPWSQYITGQEQGTNPNYDPLQIMLDFTREYGMELHASLNPYRVTMPDTELVDLSEDNIAKKHPDWVIHHEKQYYLNPGLPEVEDYVLSVIKELVESYEINAVHMEDYFYPGIDFSDQDTYEKYGETFESIGDWRRDNINQLVENINLIIKNVKPQVQFGISPSGIWRNKSDDSIGSLTSGQAHYDNHFVDSRYWIQNELIDYIAPQIYWSRDNSDANYTMLVNWWSEQVKKYNVNLYIGMADYKVGNNSDEAWNNPRELSEQIKINRANEEVKGQMHFTLNNIIENSLKYNDILVDKRYQNKALHPTTSWNNEVIPKLPKSVQLIEHEDTIKINIESGNNTETSKYAIYRFSEDEEPNYNNGKHIIGIVYNEDKEIIFTDDTIEKDITYTYGVASLSSTGVENSKPYEVMMQTDKSKLDSLVKQAKTYNEKDFTEESFKLFLDALKAAQDVLVDEHVGQAEINLKLEALKKMIAELEKLFDISALEKLIEKAKSISNEEKIYTEESFANLQKSINSVEEILPSITTEEDLEKEFNLLKDTIENLERVVEEDIQDNLESNIEEIDDNKLLVDQEEEVVLPGEVSKPEQLHKNERLNDSVYDDVQPTTSKQKTGGKLPKTATTIFNWLLIGITFSVIGSLLLYKSRRNNKVKSYLI